MPLFYEPGKTEHNLQYDPFKACVVPRPIGWISTVSNTSPPVHNLAPFSQFNNLTYDPPYVMFAANQNAAGQPKDSTRNAEATKKFGWSLATYDLREHVNASAQFFDASVDEFKVAGLEKTYGTVYPDLPLVKKSPVRFECEYFATWKLPGNPPMGSVDIVVGKVVGVHIDDSALDERGRVDVKRTRPIARMGYYEYTVVDNVFEMIIPGDAITLAGLEGRASKSLEATAKIAEPIDDEDTVEREVNGTVRNM